MFNPLVGASLVEELHVFFGHSIQMTLPQDEHVVKAFSPYAAQESFADRIGFRCAIGRFQDFNSASCCHSRKTLAVSTIAIPNQKARSLIEGRRFAELLSYPCIGGMDRDIKVNDAPCGQLNDEEQMQLAKEEVDHRQEIASPDIFDMIVEKNRPGLIRRTRRTRQPHVFLNRRRSDLNIQLEEFPTNPFSAPKRIFLCHLLNQVDCFGG